MSQFSATPWPHLAALAEEELLAQCDRSTNRTRGPGGQHRNKVESQVLLVHMGSGVAAQASERRSAVENQRVAIRRLRLALAVEVRGAVPPGEVGSALWKSRVKAPAVKETTEEILPGVRVRVPGTRGGRIECSPNHHDYPALLAEALDVICDAGWDIKRAAVRLGVSTSQLLKLIKDHPPALLRLNKERQARGEHTLK